MILRDDQGNQVDYFQNFPKEEKNIGLMLSGGADSALILYCFMRMFLSQGRKDVKIYPMHGYDTAKKNIKSWQAAESVIEEIKKKFDHIENDIIQPLQVFAYCKEGEEPKEKYHRPNYAYIMDRYNIKHIVRGWSKPPPGTEREGNLFESDIKPIKMPWINIDKKFIAYQYNKFKLDELYKVTRSCIADPDYLNGPPCRTCWWCKEKYWAFGSYDGGIQ